MMSIYGGTPSYSNFIVYTQEEFGYKIIALDITSMKTYYSLPIPMLRYGLAISHSSVFLIGGISMISRNSLSVCIHWDILTGNFEPMPELSKPKHSPHCVVLNKETIYSVGGYIILPDERVIPQQSCEAYSIRLKKWLYLPAVPLHPATPVLAAFIFRDKLCTFSENIACFLDYNSLEEGWQSVTSKEQFLISEMSHAVPISTSEVLLFGGNGVEYLYNMENLQGEGRLSALRVYSQNTILRTDKINGLLVFDTDQKLWVFNCTQKKWKFVELTKLQDEASLTDLIDKLSI